MDKTFEYTIKRDIQFKQLQDDFYVFKETKNVGKKKPIIIQGVTTQEVIDKCNQYEEIKLAEYALYDKDILEYSRNNLFGNSYEKFQKYLIKNPYDYFTGDDLTEVVFIKVSYYDHNIYDVDGNKYPKAIYFDYIEAGMHNNNYNLQRTLEILKIRDDIELFTKEVKPIPYYNSSDDQDMYLEFAWHPSNEDFNKIRDISDKWEMYKTINNHIFGLPKKDEIRVGKFKVKR